MVEFFKIGQKLSIFCKIYAEKKFNCAQPLRNSSPEFGAHLLDLFGPPKQWPRCSLCYICKPWCWGASWNCSQAPPLTTLRSPEGWSQGRREAQDLWPKGLRAPDFSQRGLDCLDNVTGSPFCIRNTPYTYPSWIGGPSPQSPGPWGWLSWQSSWQRCGRIQRHCNLLDVANRLPSWHILDFSSVCGGQPCLRTLPPPILHSVLPLLPLMALMIFWNALT